MPTGDHVLKDIRDWKDVVKFPDLEAIDWEQAAYYDLHVDGAAKLNGNKDKMLDNGATFMDGDKLGVGMIPNGMFERLHALMGFDNALVAIMTEPEACYEFFSAVADWKIEFIKKIKQYYPIEVINAHDDYAYTKGPFMSLNLWRELIKPNLQKIVDATHDLGLIYQHHSCGRIGQFIPEFVEMGIDAVDSFQGNCNPDLKELKDKYGKQITFVGGLNSVEVYDRKEATFDEYVAEYKRVTDILAPGGSYIAFPGVLNAGAMPAILATHFSYAVPFYNGMGEKKKVI
ncbi:MAG: uroporphyrinogen decarboxylase family protein [Oscillospiraceae bacterium]